MAATTLDLAHTQWHLAPASIKTYCGTAVSNISSRHTYSKVSHSECYTFF